jgi:tetratricopeptide (TPR) repeat protein
MGFNSILFRVFFLLTTLTLFTPAQIINEKTEDAYRANNLGVALLEQYKHEDAIKEFRLALQLKPDLNLAKINLAIALFNAQKLPEAKQTALEVLKNNPDSPQANYILGLIGRTENNPAESLAAFRKILEIDPNDVGANVNIGQTLLQQKQYDEALKHFQTAYNSEPYNTTAVYNLATTLQRQGERQRAAELLKTFQTLRENGAGTSLGLNYLEQGRYAEAIASTGAETELVDKTEPNIVFQNNVNEVFPNFLAQKVKFKPRRFETVANSAIGGKFDFFDAKTRQETLESLRGGATLFDFDNDNDLDLVQITTNGQKLFRNDSGKFIDVTKTSGDLAKITNDVGTGIIAGDFDNDRKTDLFILRYGKSQLYRNVGQARFIDVTQKAQIPVYPFLSIACAFSDVDHDGDLDIFIAGLADISRNTGGEFFPYDLPKAPNLLLRNNGNGTFTDISEAAKVKEPQGHAVAVVPTDFDNRRDIDLLVVNYGKPALYQNLRDTTFRLATQNVGLDKEGQWTCVAVGDYNKDSFVDFFFGAKYGTSFLAESNGKGGYQWHEVSSLGFITAAQFIDYDNDGLLDLVTQSEFKLEILRNLGNGFSQPNSALFKIKADKNNDLSNSRFLLSGDINNDGFLDFFSYARNKSLHLIKSVPDLKEHNKFNLLQLQGRVSNKTAIGAKIDLRVGSLAQKLETYSASPMPAPSQIHFGLGKRQKPDAVRIIWTSGIVQAETDFPDAQAKNVKPLTFEELDRKPSSCPYLFTWNGEKFEFITDFLGGGEMGNWAAPGQYHFPDSDEFIRIPSDKLKPKNGRYEIRVTNELEEVLFLDHLKLVAVEHPANTEVFPNEGLGIPTFGQRILYTTQNAQTPVSATDHNGNEVLDKIKETDRSFYDSFKPLPIRGYAETHALTLNLDHQKDFHGRTLLLLTGWTDYAFSSDNLAASQSGKSLFLPYLQVKNQQGEWQTVIDRIGISIGRPQTVVVDLTNKFLTDSREVRIVTNFKTYWDKIEVNTSAPNPELQTTELYPIQADLRQRGFSAETITNGMITADYDTVFQDGRWKYFAGKFTRFGDVKRLLKEVDDLFVISQTGDELVLSFNALPEPPAGKKYTFLLYADGYSKEMDINSGSPETVFPLPFKGMTNYPYNSAEKFPLTDEKQRIYDEFTTRTIRGGAPNIDLNLMPKR